LYRAGLLSLKLASKLSSKTPDYTELLEKSDKYLTQLAGLDFNYREVAALLDKLAQMRNNG